MDINNLPGSQLRAPVEIMNPYDANENSDSEMDSDEDIPLSILCGKSTYNSNRKMNTGENVIPAKSFVWKKNSALNNFPDFVEPVGTNDNNSPLELFELFFDKDVLNLLLHHTNNDYNNRSADIKIDEIQCFIGILMVSGYVTVPRRSQII